MKITYDAWIHNYAGIRVCVQGLGCNMDAQKCKSLVSVYDLDLSGELEMEEFVTCMMLEHVRVRGAITQSECVRNILRDSCSSKPNSRRAQAQNQGERVFNADFKINDILFPHVFATIARAPVESKGGSTRRNVVGRTNDEVTEKLDAPRHAVPQHGIP